MSYKDKLDQLRNKYDISDKLVNNKNDTDIMDQLSSYNVKQVESDINNFEQILEEQKNLNIILSEDKADENKKKIENFIKEYSNIIDKQNEYLIVLSNNLKKLIDENNILKKNNNDFKYMLSSNQYTELARKIREINSNCIGIKHFLVKQGILNN